MENYNPKNIEPKWQQYWVEHPELDSADDSSNKPKKYILDMFPYPSAVGLHVGHVESYTATDIASRYYRMKGFNVLHPQGWDAFGLPAENYAIKTGVHPNIVTHENIANFTRQIKSLGLSYDWSREIDTSNPEYYKWTQWFFLFLYENGLAYKKKAKVNWCESCQTVLANEQAEGGICERCKNAVIQKDLEQWFFKITDFIENNKNTTGLLEGLDKLDWPESIKAAQKNWIGRSEGATIKFQITNSNPSAGGQNSNIQKFIEVFTTRVDTIFGCTYCVVAPEHKAIQELKEAIENWDEVAGYIEKAKSKTDLDRMEAKEKTGVELKGVKVVNPFNNEEVPLFIADYVLAQYGTGAVMAVPAHDERDFDFAKKYDLPIKDVIAPYWLDQQYPPKIDKETEEREVVCIIVRNPKDNKYLGLKWSITGWLSFPTGGVDGEDLVVAAKREILEEVGYKNLKFITKIPGSTYAEFYRPHKDSNVIAHFHYVVFDLENEDRDVVAVEETDKHEAVWIAENEIESFINVENQQFAWKKYKQANFAFTGDGILIDSGKFDGLKSEEAREGMIGWLEKEGLGNKVVNYRLRDWLVSRQRYWGAPIPIIYCEKCGEVAVPKDDLPVVLPTDVDFKPTGESPLANSKSFHTVNCPKCGEAARRESDTMDTFVCSSWYYFRYTDYQNDAEFAGKEKIQKWLPVDLYVGGAEHAVLHLLYARFFTKALHNLGYVDFDEPFLKLRNQGMILAEDGHKMSKSLGNVVNPDDAVAEFGADSLRMFEMFMGPLEDAKPWNTQGMVGIKRFLERVWRLQEKTVDSRNRNIESAVHKTIKKVSADIEAMKFNTAISAMMILVNEAEKNGMPVADYKLFVKILSPFAPHITEEIWKNLGHAESIFSSDWPGYDSELIQDEEISLVIQINGKVRDMIVASANISEEEAKEKALASEKVKNHLEGKEIRKIIFVKNKLINIVV